MTTDSSDELKARRFSVVFQCACGRWWLAPLFLAGKAVVCCLQCERPQVIPCPSLVRDNYISVKELRASGWTNRSIQEFLGNPDLIERFWSLDDEPVPASLVLDGAYLGVRNWTDLDCGRCLRAHSIKLYDRAKMLRIAQERIKDVGPKERKFLMRELVEANAELIADKGIQ